MDGFSSRRVTNQRLYELVSNLSSSSSMTDAQQADFNRLWASWSIQRANILLTAGDQRHALAILEAAVQAFPKNIDVYNALAGAYLKAGQPKQAVAIYSSLDMDHATLQQYQGAIGSAMAARDMSHAEEWLEIALDRFKTTRAFLSWQRSMSRLVVTTSAPQRITVQHSMPWGRHLSAVFCHPGLERPMGLLRPLRSNSGQCWLQSVTFRVRL